jgi:chemotaxis protein MotB
VSSASGNIHLPAGNGLEEALDAAANQDEVLNEDDKLAAKISAVSHRRRPSVTDGISPDEEEAEGWITSYMDVITLLLAFFVMLLALANFETPMPGGAVAESVAEPIGDNVRPTNRPNVSATAASTDASTAARLEQFARSLRDSIDAAMLASGDLAVTVLDNMVIVDISDGIAFDEGAVALSVDGTAVVDNMALQLVLTKFFVGRLPHITVEGHTDNRPTRTAAFPSNWELSSARASGVVRRLIEQGVAPDRLRAVGYADLHPRGSNTTPEGRGQNRRVTLVIHEPGQSGRAAGQF